MQNPASPTAVGGHQLKIGPVGCEANVSPGHFPWRSVHLAKAMLHGRFVGASCLMTAWGHSLPSHFAPVPTIVRS